jgi:hypothetical protein
MKKMKKIILFGLVGLLMLLIGACSSSEEQDMTTKVKVEDAVKPLEKKLKPTKPETTTVVAKNDAMPVWKDIALGHFVSYENNIVTLNEIMEGEIMLHVKDPSILKEIQKGDPVKLQTTKYSDGNVFIDSIKKVTEKELDPDSDMPVKTEDVTVSFVGKDGELFVVTDGKKEYEINPSETNTQVFGNAKVNDKFIGKLYTYKDRFQLLDELEKAKK